MEQTDRIAKPHFFKEAASGELRHILNWWQKHLVDEENEGFFGRITGQGTTLKDADKSIILNTRILWTFATGARATGDESYKATADRAYAYLKQYFVDPEHGGVYWMLNFKGNVADSKKQIYAQAFAIYAFTEYYLLTQHEEALKDAQAIFQLLEQYSLDKEHNGYFEAFDQEWNLLEDLRLSSQEPNEAKTMNTHLHVLEAYTNLYRVDKSKTIQQALKNLIELFLNRFIDHDRYQLHLFFDEQWNLKSNIISYGHDIECSWLLYEAAEVLGDEELLKKTKSVSIQMAEKVYQEGMDQDGAIWNDRKGDHLDQSKHWWPQAEAIVGFWNVWELSGDVRFQTAAFHCWSFISQRIIDHQSGEWIWGLDEQGNPDLSLDKAGPWKAPYHNGRMCVEIMRRIG